MRSEHTQKGAAQAGTIEDLRARAINAGLVRLFCQGTNLAFRLAYIAIMARLLEPADFGLVAMATAITGIYDLFTSAGLSTAAVQRDGITLDQISGLFWINMLVGAILGLACVATAPVLVAFYNEPNLLWVTAAMGIGFLVNAAGVQHGALLQRELRYLALSTIDTVSQTIGYATGIAIAILGGRYWSLVAAAVITPAIMTACLWIAVPWVPGAPRRGAELRSLIRFGTTVTLNGLVIYLAYNLEKILLGRFWGADALGIYGRAYQLINIPTLSLNSAIGMVAFSALSRLQGEPDRLKRYFIKSYTIVVSLTAPTTLFCALFADDIIQLALGAKWADAAIIFRLLAPTVIVFGIINPASWLLLSLGLQQRSLAIALVIAPLVITATVVGLPHGPQGVAFAYSTVMMLWLVPHVLWCLHKTPVSPRELACATFPPLLSSIIAASASFAVIYCLGWEHLPLPIRLLFEASLMGGSYVCILLFAFDQTELYVDLLRGLRGTRWPLSRAHR